MSEYWHKALVLEDEIGRLERALSAARHENATLLARGRVYLSENARLRELAEAVAGCKVKTSCPHCKDHAVRTLAETQGSPRADSATEGETRNERNRQAAKASQRKDPGFPLSR